MKTENLLLAFGFINTCITLGRFYLYAFTGKDFFYNSLSFQAKFDLSIGMFFLSVIPILIGTAIKNKW